MQPAGRTSAREYLERERGSETKHELVNGIVVAMAGASPRHNAIVGNVIGLLRQVLRDRPCLVLASDQRVHVESTGLYTYPDATVICERARFHADDSDTLLNPTVILEVLSPSTEAYDRGAKFAHYRSIASLQECVLVSQPERRVEHYRRLESGQWILTEYVGDEAKVALPALACETPLAELYAKTELLDDADPPAAP
jgi:Uma2 family endonuclease